MTLLEYGLQQSKQSTQCKKSEQRGGKALGTGSYGGYYTLNDDPVVYKLFTNFQYYKIYSVDYSDSTRKVKSTPKSEIASNLNELLQFDKHVVIKIMHQWVLYLNHDKNSSYRKPSIKQLQADNQKAAIEIYRMRSMIQCMRNFDTLPVFKHNQDVFFALVLFNEDNKTDNTEYLFPLSLRCDGDLLAFFNGIVQHDRDEQSQSRNLINVATTAFTFGKLLDEDCNLAHGDIKPANVLYKYDEDGKSVRFFVTDFGTVDKVPILYTPGYMQLDCRTFNGKGEAKTVQEQKTLERQCARKNDLFAIGLVLLQHVEIASRVMSGQSVSPQFKHMIRVMIQLITWCLAMPSNASAVDLMGAVQSPGLNVQSYLSQACWEFRKGSRCSSTPQDELDNWTMKRGIDNYLKHNMKKMETYTFSAALEILDQLNPKPKAPAKPKPVYSYAPVVLQKPATMKAFTGSFADVNGDNKQIQQQQQSAPVFQGFQQGFQGSKNVKAYQPSQQPVSFGSFVNVGKLSSSYQQVQQQQAANAKKANHQQVPMFKNALLPTRYTPPAPSRMIVRYQDDDRGDDKNLKDITINGVPIVPPYKKPGYAEAMNKMMQMYDSKQAKFSISDQLAILEWKWRRTSK